MADEENTSLRNVEADSEPSQARIHKLDNSVVNRIAAGEIIVQPANALKEILENSIDANASTIEVVVKDGGLKLLQITDNGSGIHREDMELLCERFATSKLRTYNDLTSISTFGFRGEALASISHISHLSVISKVASSPLAYKSFYLNGKLCSPKFKLEPLASAPKPVAGKDGTQITVEDLFYNLASRLKALRSKSDEWAKILDVVGKYAVHTEGVGFTCKKFGESLPAISTRPLVPLKERIRTVYGTSVAADLIEFDFPGLEYGLANLRGAISGFNYNSKRRVPPIFFINNRLVACDPLKRALASVFLVFLPKGNHPFIYVSFDVTPQNLDVNIHPTKSEVRFLFEDEIIEWISGKIHDVLSTKQGSRKFTQSVLKRQPDGIALDEVSHSSKKYRQENKLVRVDASQLKISQFVKQDTKGAFALQSSELTDDKEEGALMSQKSLILEDSSDTQFGLQPRSGTAQASPRRNVELESIKNLRQKLGQSIHRPLTNIFSNLVNVGIVDAFKRLVCFQYDVKLFLCDYGAVLYEFYYQLALSDFANYGEYVLDVPLDLRTILQPLYETRDDLKDIDEVIGSILSMKDMFSEYFQMGFEDSKLLKIPILLKDVIPSAVKLPLFIYRLGAKVDYLIEQKCLEDVMRQIALLYVPDRIPPGVTEEEDLLALVEVAKVNFVLEHEIFPELRRRFIAPECLADQVTPVADLPGLYRVFERC